jgi:hypothetical protein
MSAAKARAPNRAAKTEIANAAVFMEAPRSNEYSTRRF